MHDACLAAIFRFKFQTAKTRPVDTVIARSEADEAIQLSLCAALKLDCFVASAPRKDVGTYLRDLAARFLLEVCSLVRLPLERGRRECRAPDAPDSRVCNGSGRTHTR
jgi:hypothetical protein